ncbi:hypothetical protein EJB05_43877, partial [Eragrostis curvula]
MARMPTMEKCKAYLHADMCAVPTVAVQAEESERESCSQLLTGKTVLTPGRLFILHSRSVSAWVVSMAAMHDVVWAVGAATPSPATATTETTDAEKLRFIEEMTTNLDAVQERVLAEILGRNAETEYLLKKCGLGGATDRSTFRARVPVATYEDMEPYIRRIAGGDRSPVLTGAAHPVTEFFTSSGTSGGERKLLPTVEDEADRRLLLQSLITPVMNQYVPGLRNGLVLYFLSVQPESTTAGGLPARTFVTSSCKSNHFRHGDSRTITSPVAAVLCEDAFQSAYAQMLCGLCRRHEVLCVGAVFASALLRAIRFLEMNWEQLAADIGAGELGPQVTDQSVREAVAGVLRAPDPDLARFVRAECSKGDWAGIIKRIWPNTKCLYAIVTGSMAQYVPTLDYYSGGLPVASTLYASSECHMGINLRPMCHPSEVSYTIMPNMAYFEFLPVDGDGDDESSQLVELARVEAGREYEVVVTTYAGLSRYRVGDVLRVTGFHNAAPEFRFVRRRNVLLSVDADKTDEAELQRAVDRASAALRRRTGGAARVLEYTSRACTESIPGHYVVYWELLLPPSDNKQGAAVVNGDVLEMCCLEMEEALSSVYRQKRVADSSIAPLEIRVVRAGTFEALMDYAVARGTSMSQYKVPRCVTESPAIVDLLDSRVVSTHFSSALPHWAPDQRSNE